jgi:HlyD family secretion protein
VTGADAPAAAPRDVEAPGERARRSLGRVALIALLIAAPSCARRGAEVTGSGTVEMDEIDVASMIGGRIVRLAVDEGDTVSAGDTVAVLDRGEVAAQLLESVAQAERARAQERDLRAGARRDEIEAARAEVEAAAAQERLGDAELERVRALRARDVVPAAELDRAQSARDAAAARRRAAAERVDLLRQGARRDQIAAAGDAATAAAAQEQGARARARELVLVAPSAGVVLLRNFEVGELLPAGVPVVTLGDPERLWIRVYVATPELPRVRLGAAAEIRVQGENRRWPGRVVEIAREAEFVPRAALTEEERANLVFGVKIALDPTGGTLKPGLPATARVIAAADTAARAGG